MTAGQGRYGADLHDIDKQVQVRYPVTAEQEAGPREGWPWVPGWVAEVCGSDEWQVCVQASGLGRTAEGEIPAPGVPDEELYFPLVFRDSSEIRDPSPGREPEAGQ
jgi:hypothetical protein